MISTYSLVLIALCSLIYFNDEVKANCGGLIEGANGTITSPGYPLNYPPNQDCLWEIKGTPNKKIWFQFKHFLLEGRDRRRRTCIDFVTIRSMKDGLIREHETICGYEKNNYNFSDSNIVYINFKSDGFLQNPGFQMDFYSVPFDCGGLLKESEGIITSPRYPLPYPPYLNCTWTIQVPLNLIIQLNFTQYETEESNECAEDYVTTQSKMANGDFRQQERFCGKKSPFTILSESNILLLQFVAHSNKGHKGFTAGFKSVLFECGGLLERSEGIITSPRFQVQDLPYMNCTWYIKAPLNHTIKLTLTHFEIEKSNDCVEEYVTVQNKMANGKIRQHGKFCGRKAPPSIFTDSNDLQIQFYSHSYKGEEVFRAKFTSDECGGSIKGGKGNISSPFFPDLYRPNMVCKWNFLVPPHHKIKLNFLKFEVEGSIGCLSDFLLIQSNSTDGKVFEYGKYCGHFGPSQINSKEKIIVTLVSDRSTEKKGFLVEYFIDKLTDFEASISSEKSTTPVENQNDDITNDFIMSRKEENTFHDNYDSTTSSALTTATSTYSPNQPKTEKQQKETEDVIVSITNILSALTSLTKKVADIEERQIMLFNQYENMFNSVWFNSQSFSCHWFQFIKLKKKLSRS